MASIWKPSKPPRGVKLWVWPLARVSTRASEQRINADASDYTGTHLRCGCGESARYAGLAVSDFAHATVS